MRSRKSLFRPGRRDGVEMELRHHIQERAERLVEEGWDPEEARAEAERRFGELARWRDETLLENADDEGRRWIMGGFDALVQDLRYAVRGVRRNPGFAVALIATLALGIGAAGAIFSVVDAVLLRPLPYHEPDRVVEAQLGLPSGFRLPEVMADQVAPWTEGADFLQRVAAHGRRALVRTDTGEPEQVGAVVASASLDEVLGIGVALGRPLGPGDEEPGVRTALMTWEYWARTGRDPEVVGQELELDGERWTVVGVLPRGVKYPVGGTVELWIPLARDLTAAGRPFGQLGMVGRLADGLSLEAAQEEAAALGAALAESAPNEAGWDIQLVPVGSWRGNPDTKRGLWMVAGAVGLMFLIALFNAANLLLVRGQARLGEVGVRKALGASRLRVIRQVLAETVLLALLGGVVATGIAWLSVEGIRLIAPRELTFGMVHPFGLERRALAMVFAVALGTGVAVGLFPALRLASVHLPGAGAASQRGRDRSAHRLRGILVAAEIATSVVLLVGAGLFLRSFAAMQGADLGMEADRVAVVSFQLPRSRYPTGADQGAVLAQMLERLRSLPGVESAAAAQGVPPEGSGLVFATGLQAEGDEPLPVGVDLPFTYAGEGLLATLGTRLVAGRELRPQDREIQGVLVDGDLARQVFGGVDAVGRRFRLDESGPWRTVVGVVEELRLGGLDNDLGEGALVLPLNPEAPPGYLTLVVRTPGDPEALLPAIRRAFLEVDPRLPLARLRTGEGAVGAAAVRPRFLVLLMGTLAGIALLLASVGIFGVLSYLVRQRHREVGIRLALGATPRQVRRGVLRWGLTLGVAGTAVGLWLAFLLDGYVAALLYQVRPGDPATAVGVALAMLAVTAAACAIPSRRATRVDPVEVLRAE